MENFQYYTPTKIIFGRGQKSRQDSWQRSRGVKKCWSIMAAGAW